MTEQPQQDELDLELDDETANVEVLTVNQLVAYNLMRLRRARGWTQQETAKKLTERTKRKWTAASLSASERSWQTERSRQFDANELAAFSDVFECPISYFFLPIKPAPGKEIFYALAKVDNALPFPILRFQELLDLAVPLRYPSTLIDQVNDLRKSTGITWSPWARVERWDEGEEAYYDHMAETAEQEGGAEQPHDSDMELSLGDNVTVSVNPITGEKEMTVTITKEELAKTIRKVTQEVMHKAFQLGASDDEDYTDEPPF